MTGSNHSVTQHHSSSAVQVHNGNVNECSMETKQTSTSTNTEEENKNVVTETDDKVVQTTTINNIESCKIMHNIGVLSKENQKNSNAHINICHEEKIANNHHVLKLTKMNWLNQMGTSTPRARGSNIEVNALTGAKNRSYKRIENLSTRSLSSIELNSDNSEAGFSDETDVGLKCLSTVLNLDKEHNMFGLSSYGDVLLQRPREQPKTRKGKPVFHQTTIIHACCTVKCGPPKGCKSKCCTPKCCKHVSNTDLPSSLNMGAGSCLLTCTSPCLRIPSCCANPCIYTCSPGASGRSCSRKCSRPCSQPCLPFPRRCPPKPCPPKPCARPCPPKPCSRPCSRTCIRPCPRPCVKQCPPRRRSSRFIACEIPKVCKCARPRSCKICSSCSPCFGMTVTEKKAVSYEPSPVEVIPRAPCIMSKPLMARPCPHCPPCLPPSGCYPYLMPCHLPARPEAPCTEPGSCFHTPPCPAPRVPFDPMLSDGIYKSPCAKSCEEYSQGRKDTTKKCPIVICPGNNPELIDAIRKVYDGRPVHEKNPSK